MVETFQATRDAVLRVVAPIVSKRPPRFKEPWYFAEPGRTSRPGLTPETGLDEAIERLAARTGHRMVRQPDGGLRTSTPDAGRVH
jgi:hypothetical protein